MDKRAETAADARKSPESMVSSLRPSLANVQQARLRSVPLVKCCMLLDYALT